ncbi:MAG: AbrB family transcriptional regulator [Bifidobacteriaceae bacterium]|jgi:hypothetical protein|nr:AbrB family transcriptional regulator [Bifidobacteriaceae bacterium]MCI1914595.1 AbrB family transcriptional regulator [Bifidobacteriaceae bacterium]
MTDEAQTDAAASTAQTEDGTHFETLTESYERLRHSTDSEELSAMARAPLPERSDAAAFSRATSLLEAVAGNQNTSVDDRVYLASTMPFPNILVKLSEDPEPAVRREVAKNVDSKNWLAGRLTKDEDPSVRTAALLNPQTSWKMRLEGAQDPRSTPEALEFLATVGTGAEDKAPSVLASMVRRAVALNPNTPQGIVDQLKQDSEIQVRHAAESR